MAKHLEIYSCAVCGIIIEVMHAGDGELVCCGQPMKFIAEGVTDAAKEKHVPVIEKTATGYKVTVGSVEHPMEEKHYIEWIELVADGISYTQFLKPGQKPQAEFCTNAKSVTVREYCNLHGQWKSAN